MVTLNRRQQFVSSEPSIAHQYVEPRLQLIKRSILKNMIKANKDWLLETYGDPTKKTLDRREGSGVDLRHEFALTVTSKIGRPTLVCGRRG